jgi:glycosyltransferase involved in cell wall biosynthesis
MHPIKVAFIPAGVSGVVFYRVWQPYGALSEAKGIQSICWWYTTDQYTLHPWENEVMDPQKGPSIQYDIDAACAWADVVVWMSLHSLAALELFREMKRKHGKIFLTEIDDYVLSIPAKNQASEYFRPGSDMVAYAVDQFRESDGLVVSTPYLGDLYKKFNKNIHVVENCIDTGLWHVSEENSSDAVKIGWMGGGTHEEDLEIVKDVVFEILEEHPNVSFHFLHGVPRFFRDVPRIKADLGFKPVDKYPKWVMKAGFDIGIAPLEDNNFNRGKSNLRWLEYSAMGIPTVASPLPHFVQSIEEGKTGFIANTKDEWKTNLKNLIADKILRRAIGLNARKEVETNWSIRTLRDRYKTVLEDVTNAKLHAV